MAEKKFLVNINTDGDVIANGVTLTGQSDWNATSGGSEILNKPSLLYTISIITADRDMAVTDSNRYIYNDSNITLTFQDHSTWNVPVGSSGMFKRIEADGTFEILAGAGVEINGEESVTYEIDEGSSLDTNGCTWIKVAANSYHILGAVTKVL